MVDKSIQLKAYANGEILTAEDLNTSIQDVGAVQYLVPYNSALSKDSAGVVFIGTTAYPLSGIVLKTGYKLLQSDGVNTTEITLSGGSGNSISNIEALSAAEKFGQSYPISEQYYLNESYTKADPYMLKLGKTYGTGDGTLIYLHNDYYNISKCNAVNDGTGAWSSLGPTAGAALVGGTTSLEGGAAIYCTVGATTGENGLRYIIGTTGISLQDQKLRYGLWLSTLSNITTVKTVITGNSGTVDNYSWSQTQQASGSSLVAGWNWMEVNLASTATASAGSFSASQARQMHVLITPTSSQSWVMAVDDLCRVSEEEIDLPHIAQIGDTVNTQLLYIQSGANGVYQTGTTILNNYDISATTIGQRFVPKTNSNTFEFPTGSSVLSGASAKEIWDISSKDFDSVLSNKTLTLSGQFNSPEYEIIDIPSANSMKLKTISGTGDSLSFVAGSEMVGYAKKWNGYEYVSPYNATIGANFKKFTISGSTTVSGTEITVNHTESNSGFDANGKFFVTNKVANEYYGIGNTGSKIELIKATPTIFIPKDEGIAYPIYVHSHWPLNEISGNAKNKRQPSGLYDLTQGGTVPSAAGKLGLARGPFSTANYFQNNESIYRTAKTFSAGAWVKTSVTGVYQTIFSNIPSNTGVEGWQVGINASNYATAIIGPGSPVTIAGTTNICDGNWHYIFICVLLTSGANNFRLYVDGSLVAQTTGSAFTTPSGVWENLKIGQNQNGSGTRIEPFQGLIDSPEYSSTVPATWSEQETIIANRYAQGRGMEYSYSPGYIQKSTISSVSGNKLITATKITRNDSTGQLPSNLQRNAVIV